MAIRFVELVGAEPGKRLFGFWNVQTYESRLVRLDDTEAWMWWSEFFESYRTEADPFRSVEGLPPIDDFLSMCPIWVFSPSQTAPPCPSDLPGTIRALSDAAMGSGETVALGEVGLEVAGEVEKLQGRQGDWEKSTQLLAETCKRVQAIVKAMRAGRDTREEREMAWNCTLSAKNFLLRVTPELYAEGEGVGSHNGGVLR